MSLVTTDSPLKRLRLERGYTLEGLARVVGVTLSAVAQWEAGRTTPRRASVLALEKALSAEGELLAAFGYAPLSQPSGASEELAQRLSALEQMVSLGYRRLRGITLTLLG